MDPVKTVVHPLNIREAGDNRIRVRGTIRIGQVPVGSSLEFKTTDGRTHRLSVLCVDEGKRHVELLLQGDSVAELTAGRFLTSV